MTIREHRGHKMSGVSGLRIVATSPPGDWFYGLAPSGSPRHAPVLARARPDPLPGTREWWTLDGQPRTADREGRSEEGVKIIGTEVPGVLILEPEVFGDERGFFLESYNRTVLAEVAGITDDFVQDNHSRSGRGVLRGLH
jgi:hypothetical protein